jgi:hypothetical protein
LDGGVADGRGTGQFAHEEAGAQVNMAEEVEVVWRA